MNTKSKQILYFIGLKILEVGGIFLAILIGHLFVTLGLGFERYTINPYFWFFLTGLLGICLITTIIIFSGLIYFRVVYFIKANWRKAGELAER